MNKRSQINCWQALYESLFKLLTEATEPNNLDKYCLLIDDNWGGHHQKLCVFKDDFLSAVLIQKIQLLLKNQFQDWGLIVVFEGELERAPLVIYFDNTSAELRWE
jgi:hypothetical protein